MADEDNIHYIRVWVGEDGQGYYQTIHRNGKIGSTSEGYGVKSSDRDVQMDNMNQAHVQAIAAYPDEEMRLEAPPG